MIADTVFHVLSQHGIPVDSDTRRWFQQGRTDRGMAKNLDTAKQSAALKRLVGFRSWGNAARCLGWLYEHKCLTQPVRAATPIMTRNSEEARHFANIIASRYEEVI